MPALRTSLLVLYALVALSAKLPAQNRTTIGGYGEIHYTNPSGPNTPAEVNVKRFVVFLGHSFSDRLAFRSELEVEDAKISGGTPGGEVSLEQLYIDYRLGAGATLRTGLVLVPIGIINEIHEPPTFNGVDRPAFDHDVIPTTWREIGVGAQGTLPWPGLSYKAYVVSGLVAANFGGAEGVREGRQEGRQATFANPSITGRLEYARPGLRVGASFWHGGTTAGDTLLPEGSFAAPLTVVAADARWDHGPFAVRAEAANLTLGQAAAINARYGTDVGSRIAGGYVEGAVNVLQFLARGTAQRLNLFARHERYDTHARVPSGTARNGAYDRRVTTIGLSWLPVTEVAFKADYAFRRNRGANGEDEVLSLGVGYRF